MTYVQHASLAALATGRLVLSDGCFYLASLYTAKRESLVWPYKFSSRASPAGVYDESGRLVARPGEKVVVGGGPEVLAHVAPGTMTNTKCLAGARTAWFISSVSHL